MTRELPDHVTIALSGQGAGLSAPLFGRFTAGKLRQCITDINNFRANGQAVDSMPGQILEELRRADVAKLSAAHGQGWSDLLEDLLLWHASREVFGALGNGHAPMRKG